MAGVFCDSFSHYNTAGIALKYSTAGGSIQSDPAHVRTVQTAPALSQSLEIQAGDAPSIINFTLPPDTAQAYSFAEFFYNFAVGLAYQAGALNGTIYQLWRNLTNAPSPPELLLYLVLNADGSLSLFTDGGTLLGSSAAGVISAGNFYYITLSADIGGFSEPTFATVNVATSANVATNVISVTGFTLADTFIDSIIFGGPIAPDHAWINDFYVLDLSDGSTVPLAPNIYAVVPDGDGTALNIWDNVTVAIWEPVSGTHYNLCDSIPPNESEGLQFLASPQYAPTPGYFIDSCSQTFNIACAGLPDGRSIGFIQAVFLMNYETSISGVGPVHPQVYFQHNSDGTPYLGPGSQITARPGMPYLFMPFPYSADPFTNPWLVSDWKSGVWQAGPTNFVPQ